jgi:hypothetical protein
MNKNVLHRASAILLSVVILTASMGFTVDMHYCGGKMQSFSIFGDAESCTPLEVVITCTESHQDSDSNSHCTLAQKKCCSDRMLYVQPIEDLTISMNATAVDLGTKLYAPVVDCFNCSLSVVHIEKSLNQHYRSPDLLRTNTVLLQSFLI